MHKVAPEAKLPFLHPYIQQLQAVREDSLSKVEIEYNLEDPTAFQTRMAKIDQQIQRLSGPISRSDDEKMPTGSEEDIRSGKEQLVKLFQNLKLFHQTEYDAGQKMLRSITQVSQEIIDRTASAIASLKDPTDDQIQQRWLQPCIRDIETHVDNTKRAVAELRISCQTGKKKANQAIAPLLNRLTQLQTPRV